ncbi:hypothetical protein [Actinophytocola xanthii]|uniref:Uncharacterized protein n=1 Tax=Actinophytocola xanthii TaxID=1912961 RepID=A0A1Q8CFZ8_9PSEU|nr:hypothetical protein [Actinophytocola xanthii]OLF13274.1 hypothetical protein BU204_28280 [Actinophytocola xanthii]
MSEDPERLVAEALRAHAARTPLPAPAAEPAEGASPVLGSYGLLSGSGVELPGAGQAPDQDQRGDAELTTRVEPDVPVALGWVVLLSLLLGLAAGAVVGLVTLL